MVRTKRPFWPFTCIVQLIGCPVLKLLSDSDNLFDWWQIGRDLYAWSSAPTVTRFSNPSMDSLIAAVVVRFGPDVGQPHASRGQIDQYWRDGSTQDPTLVGI
jgi:hypothetical protein